MQTQDRKGRAYEAKRSETLPAASSPLASVWLQAVVTILKVTNHQIHRHHSKDLCLGRKSEEAFTYLVPPQSPMSMCPFVPWRVNTSRISHCTAFPSAVSWDDPF
jgi:hypothetical protein